MSAQTAPKAMDLTTRSFDLIATVAKSSGPLSQAAIDVLQWLARERIDNDSFVFTMEMACFIAEPNRHGTTVITKLEKAASRLCGLQLVIPGALGRRILDDKALRWMATTEAVLLKFYDMEYVRIMLTDLLLSSKLTETDTKRPAFQARIYPVISKLVESIALHTVNIGIGIEPLPTELENLPEHCLDPETMARMVVKIRGTPEAGVLVRSDHCHKDLLSWIYHHWTGILCVSFQGRIIFEQSLGDTAATISFLVTSNCNILSCAGNDKHAAEVWVGSYSKSPLKPDFQECLGKTEPTEGGAGYSAYRTPLYKFLNPFTRGFLQLNTTEDLAARRAAQQIVRSIVETPVQPSRKSDLDALKLSMRDSGDIKFKWWIVRVPSILQLNLGAKVPPRPLHQDLEGPPFAGVHRSYSISQICEWYGEIYDASLVGRDRCECGCNTRADLTLKDDGSLFEGCVQYAIYGQTMLLIAHALAEAAGAVDISNFDGEDSSYELIAVTKQILGEISYMHAIFWHTWFRLACTAITGLPQTLIEKGLKVLSDHGNMLCWIAGSMVVVPRWFEMDQEILLQHSWGVKSLHGSVQGVIGERAIIGTQSSTEASFGAPREPTEVPEEPAQGEAVLEGIVFEVSDSLYRYMSLVRTSKSLRILDPFDIYEGLIMATRPHCDHRVPVAKLHSPWNLDEVIQCWSKTTLPHGEIAHVATISNSALNYHVAIGFTGGQCIIQTLGCCFTCLANNAVATKRVGIWRSRDSHYIDVEGT